MITSKPSGCSGCMRASPSRWNVAAHRLRLGWMTSWLAFVLAVGLGFAAPAHAEWKDVLRDAPKHRFEPAPDDFDQSWKVPLAQGEGYVTFRRTRAFGTHNKQSNRGLYSSYLNRVQGKVRNRRLKDKHREAVRKFVDSHNARSAKQLTRMAEAGLLDLSIYDNDPEAARVAIASWTLFGLEDTNGNTILEPWFNTVNPLSERHALVQTIDRRNFLYDIAEERFTPVLEHSPEGSWQVWFTTIADDVRLTYGIRNRADGGYDLAVIDASGGTQRIIPNVAGDGTLASNLFSARTITNGGQMIVRQANADGTETLHVYDFNTDEMRKSSGVKLVYIDKGKWIVGCEDKPKTCKEVNSHGFSYGLLDPIGTLPDVQTGLFDRTIYLPINPKTLQPYDLPDGVIGMIPFIPADLAKRYLDPLPLSPYGEVYKGWIVVEFDGQDYDYFMVAPVTTAHKTQYVGARKALDLYEKSRGQNWTPTQNAAKGIFRYDDFRLAQRGPDGKTYDLMKPRHADAEGVPLWHASQKGFGEIGGRYLNIHVADFVKEAATGATPQEAIRNEISRVAQARAQAESDAEEAARVAEARRRIANIEVDYKADFYRRNPHLRPGVMSHNSATPQPQSAPQPRNPDWAAILRDGYAQYQKCELQYGSGNCRWKSD